MTSLSDAERLVLALAKLREVAGECADCGGTGVVTHLDVRGSVYDTEDFCGACHDIHDVITRCSA